MPDKTSLDSNMSFKSDSASSESQSPFANLEGVGSQTSPTQPQAGTSVSSLGGTSPPASDPGAVISAPHTPQKYGGKKVIATIFGILLLIGAVASGVYLVQKQQELREKAKEKEHKIEICHVPPGNPENSHIIEVDKDAWKQGHDPHNAHALDFVIDEDDIEDDDHDDHEKRQCPPVTPTPTLPAGITTTPTQAITSTPAPTTPPEVSAQCNNVIVYNTSWQTLSSSELSSLKPGNVIRFAVSGTTSQGFFDKARFTINGTQRPEVTNKKPGTEEFYDEYTIPQGATTFTVTTKIHHTSLGWF